MGPFHAGKTEGPCLTFPLDAGRDLRAALGGLPRAVPRRGRDAVSLDRAGRPQSSERRRRARSDELRRRGLAARREAARSDWRVGTEHEKIGLYRPGYGRCPTRASAASRRCSSASPRRTAGDASLEGEHADRAREGRRQHHARARRPARALGRAAAHDPRDLQRVPGAPRADEAHLRAAGHRLARPRHPPAPRRSAELPRMPKQRYRIMRSYLPTRGDRSRST